MTLSFTTDTFLPEVSAHTLTRSAESEARPRRTRQEKADRATRRAAWAFLIPWLGVPVAAFYWFAMDDMARTGAALLVTVALALALSPLMLWWAVSGLRRGSRHLLLGLFVGCVGAFLVTAAVAGAISAGIGWSLIFGEQLPGLPGDFDMTQWVFLSPENPLNPAPLKETAEQLIPSR